MAAAEKRAAGETQGRGGRSFHWRERAVGVVSCWKPWASEAVEWGKLDGAAGT